jgi:hypothetical protein
MRRRFRLLLLIGAATLSDMPAAAQTPCVPQQPRPIHEPQGTFPFTDGLPKSVQVLESSGYAAFDTEALRAASRSRWKPMACEVAIRLPFNFRQAK